MTNDSDNKKVLVLRSCKSDMKSHGGFRWPESGPVEAPDWDPKLECGNGLHGFLWGEGNGELACWDEDAKWLVVEVDERDVIDIDGKVKFPRGNVVCCGTRLEATSWLVARAHGRAVIGASVITGYGGTATAGYCASAMAGTRGMATAGEYGMAMAGDHGTATVGDGGTAEAGNRGTAVAGDYGMATVGNWGTATAGYRGTATAGRDGTATAGAHGEIRIRWHDGARHRLAVGYVGEDGIEPNVPYVVRNGKLTRKES